MGRGEAPKTAEEWRQKFAVLDEFNRNGMVAMIHIPLGGGVKAPACTSTVSEQFRDQIAGQYSEGGGKTLFWRTAYNWKLDTAAGRASTARWAMVLKSSLAPA